ncbi:hypothetical protein OG548_45890 [Streptomyces sp. NBC_01356]|uniref:Cas10/Cmr2 second palm domain-containing protein n=1 Tax=Streptomyces sp. NBC_01356 TaxID=2903836 RepID=UPI002E33E4E5|nr:hypothetical protein [Streptomyces sp. NBC_01356]
MTVTSEGHAHDGHRSSAGQSGGGAPGPLVHVYLDIGFVRIQRYLARTAKLRGRRVASDRLARATDSAAVAAALPRELAGLAEANPEAGQADGVISLRLSAHDHGERDRLVQDVTDAVLNGLREQFPGAELEAVWATGESYLAARVAEMVPRQARGEVRVDLPAPAEFPLAQPCRLCHTDPAAALRPVPGEGKPQAICPDCAHRLEHDRQARAGERRGEQGASAESRLQAAVGCAEAPATLQDLARCTLRDDAQAPDDDTPDEELDGPAGRIGGRGGASPDRRGGSAISGGSGATQLATVYVDGNAVGAFFGALASAASSAAEADGLRHAKETISVRLAEATVDALELATLRVMDDTGGTGPLLVVPHVVGGDDVLVSLPADRAWAFTLTYLEMFRDLLEEACGPVLRLLPEPPAGHQRPMAPTASAGIVFAHSTYPMNLVVELAEERLARAKRATGGAACSIDFVDVTADGPQGTDDPALALANQDASHPVGDMPMPPALDAQTRQALTHLSRAPLSHRGELADAVRAHGPLIAARTTGTRVGHQLLADALRVFVPTQPQPSVPPARGPVSGAGPGSRPDVISLSHALRIARWWPTS